MPKDDDEAILPADIKKEEVRKGTYPTITPKKGDEVRIHYKGLSPDGHQFDTSYISEGKPYSFTLGVGAVMEAWDRIVATMKKGELSRFTIPEMYLFGGPKELLAKVPDDSNVIYEIELLGVTRIMDLFSDGSVIQTVLDEGEDYGRPPKDTDEVQLRYELQALGGDVLEVLEAIDYRLSSFVLPDGMPFARIIDKVAKELKPGMIVSLKCRHDYAFGESRSAELGIMTGAEVVIKLQLNLIYEFEDCGKKAHWGEGIVIKKAIKPIKQRMCPGMDGTKATVKLVKATSGEKQIAEEQQIEAVIADGRLNDALECACARMRKGEISLVTVKGPVDLHMSGTFPTFTTQPVEGCGPVVYHLEMVDFANPPCHEDGPSSNTERLRMCAEQKDRGAAHFKSGRWRLALERYARIVELLPRYKRESSSSSVHVDFFEYEADTKRALELKAACRLNLAACALKLESFYAAVKYCDEVLQDDPSNVKALYRRAQGRLGANDFEDAAKDCKRIIEIEPGHKEARSLLQKVRQAEKEEAKRQRTAFGGFLPASTASQS